MNNASALGAEPLVRLEGLALDGLRRALEVNVVAALGLVQEALPLLRASGAGAVIARQLGRGGRGVRDVGRLRGVEGGPGPARRRCSGEEEPGLRVWAVDPGDMGDGPVRGGRTGRRRSAAGAGRAWCRPFCGCWTSGRPAAATGRRPCWRGDDDGGGDDGSGARQELSARVPAEQRGPGLDRDGVRLLVSRGYGGVAPRVRGAAGAAAGRGPAGRQHVADAGGGGGRAVGHARVVVHFSTRGDDGRWAVELRDPDGRGTTRARAGGPAGTEVRLPGDVRLVLEEPLSGRGERLWWARVSLGGCRRGCCGSTGGPFVTPTRSGTSRCPCIRRCSRCRPPDGAGSAEMPSAARPFTARLVAELVSRGVQFAPVVLHTGVASAEAHEPPYPERFAVPEASARLVNAARAGGGRVVAVGTTAVRAVESAAGSDGVVRAREGWTDLVVTPERGVRVVDGLLTGLHEPEASHLLMLEAVAGRAAIDRGYEEALRGRYLWHEFGDVHLVLPEARKGASRRALLTATARETDAAARVSPHIGRTSRTKAP